MKIAYLAFSPQFVLFIEGLVKGLIARGHDVQIFTTHHLPPGAPDEYLQHAPIHYEPWSWFEFDSFTKFDPDLVLIWNGYAPWTYAAMRWVKLSYKTLHIEKAWLPQSNHCYIATDLAAQCPFIMNMPDDSPVDPAAIKRLKDFYKPADPDTSLPERFIFVPAQLDHDTSITISSDIYKTCDSFIGMLQRTIPDIPIVVKNHPLQQAKERPRGVIVYDWSGPLSSLDLAAQAAAVAGISSTVLVEALIHSKPTLSVGRNVGSHSHIRSFATLKSALSNPAEYTPNYHYYQTLSWLLTKQWDGQAVPEWVFELIERKGPW